MSQVNPWFYAFLGVGTIMAIRYYNEVVAVNNPKVKEQPLKETGKNAHQQRLGAQSIKAIWNSLRMEDIVSAVQKLGKYGIPKWVIQTRQGGSYSLYGHDLSHLD